MNDNYYTKSCIEKIKNLLKGGKKEKEEERIMNYVTKLNSIVEIYLEGLHSQAFTDMFSLCFKNGDCLLRTEYLGKEKENEKKGVRIISKDEHGNIIPSYPESLFYRIRTSHDNCIEYSGEEMYHIPFEMVSKVANMRYSISGFPCFYLGASVYVCWEELHRPQLETCNVSLFKLKQDIRVIDLSFKERHRFFTKSEDYLTDCLRLFCSVEVPIEKSNDPFKMEYIIPQLLMQCIVKNYNETNDASKSVLGVMYTSVHINDSKTWFNRNTKKSRNLFNNYVFPALERQSQGISPLIERLFEEYNNTSFLEFETCHSTFSNGQHNKYDLSKFGRIESFLKSHPKGMPEYNE